MPNPQVTSVGLNHSWFGFVDTDGILIGSTTTAPAAGLSTNGGMLRILGIKQASPTIPDPDVVIDTGDDGELIAEYMFPSITKRSFIVEVAIQDLAFAASLDNMPITTQAGGRQTLIDVRNAPFYSCCLILQAQSIRGDDAASGRPGWSGVIIPLAYAMYLGRAQFQERTAGVFRFNVTPQLAGYNSLGETFFDNNTVQREGRQIPFDNYNHPITMHRATGNAIITAITVDQRPIDTASSYFVSERASVPVTAVTTTPPFAVTVGSAPASNKRLVTLYQYQQ